MLSRQIYDVDDGSELLLAMLTPEAVSRTWPDLKATIESALPPMSDPTQALDRMTGVLESLLTGRLTAYAMYKIINDQAYAFGTVTVGIVHNYESTQDNLLIYTLYAHPKYVTGDYAVKFLDKMMDIAREKNCKAVMCYTASNVLKENVRRYGGNADYTLCTMEVNYGR